MCKSEKPVTIKLCWFLKTQAPKAYCKDSEFANTGRLRYIFNGFSLQNTFEKNHWLSVDFASCVVPSGELRHIPIRFFPQKPGSYKENVAFALGANRHIIYVTGEAVNVKLELCKPKDKFVNFGEVLVHSAKKYRIGVSNNSPARMSVHFALYDNLILHTRKMEKISEGLMKMPILPPSPKECVFFIYLWWF